MQSYNKVYCWQILVLLLSALISTSIAAQQTRFVKQPANDGRLFTYAWTDANNEQQSLQFHLSNSVLRSMPITGAAYNPQLSQRSVRMALLAYAKDINPKTAKIDIRQRGAQISINVSSTIPGQAQSVTQQLSEQQALAQEAYLTKHYYQHYVDHNRQKAIKHDHSRYALDSSEAMQSIVDAIKASQDNPKDVREFINLALSWIQTIPYDTLENRTSSNGSGFASPQQLLLGNRGDCDSKSTLMAAILKAYAPDAMVRMIFLPNHALLGIAMSGNAQDKTISVQNKEFVLLEPTGPAFFELGQIAPTSNTSILNRQFSSQVM